MYVCLCNGATSQTVAEAVAAGASTTKDVARVCGAGRRLRALPAYRPGDTALIDSRSNGALDLGFQRRAPPSGDMGPTSWPNRRGISSRGSTTSTNTMRS